MSPQGSKFPNPAPIFAPKIRDAFLSIIRVRRLAIAAHFSGNSDDDLIIIDSHSQLEHGDSKIFKFGSGTNLTGSPNNLKLVAHLSHQLTKFIYLI